MSKVLVMSLAGLGQKAGRFPGNAHGANFVLRHVCKPVGVQAGKGHFERYTMVKNDSLAQLRDHPVSNFAPIFVKPNCGTIRFQPSLQSSSNPVTAATEHFAEVDGNRLAVFFNGASHPCGLS